MFYSIHIHAREVNELIDLKSEKEQHHTHSNALQFVISSINNSFCLRRYR